MNAQTHLDPPALDPIALVRALVALNSVNPFETVKSEKDEIGIGNEGPIGEHLEGILKSLGFAVRRQYFQNEETILSSNQERQIPARFNLLAEKGEGDKSLLLFAHTDTVDVKDGWQTDPFTLTEEMSKRSEDLPRSRRERHERRHRGFHRGALDS